MGVGDWIMATAEARYFNTEYKLPVVFQSPKTGKVYWSEVFENNPRILKAPARGQKVVIVKNAPGNRPYVSQITPERMIWNHKFKAEPGEIWLGEKEKKVLDKDFVIVEPNTKIREFNRNKAWPWDRWVELVKEPLNWVQLGPRGTRVLPGVRYIETNTFREAMGYLNAASLLVTTDGAMHHAAAALSKPAIVLWGGLVSPNILGYDSHTNIWSGAEPCGTISSCSHCKKAMEWITVDMVRDALGHY